MYWMGIGPVFLFVVVHASTAYRLGVSESMERTLATFSEENMGKFAPKALGSLHNIMMNNVYEKLLEKSLPAVTQEDFDKIFVEQLSAFCDESDINQEDCLRGIDDEISESKYEVHDLFSSGGYYDLDSLYPRGFDNDLIKVEFEKIYKTIHKLNENNVHEILEEINEISDTVGINEDANEIDKFAVQSVTSIAVSSTEYWVDVHNNPDHLFHHLMANHDNIQQNNFGRRGLQMMENQTDVDEEDGNILNIIATIVFTPIQFILADVIGGMIPAAIGVVSLSVRAASAIFFPAAFPPLYVFSLAMLAFGVVRTAFSVLRRALCNSLQAIGIQFLPEPMDVVRCKLGLMFNVTNILFPACNFELYFGSILGKIMRNRYEAWIKPTSLGQTWTTAYIDITDAMTGILPYPPMLENGKSFVVGVIEILSGLPLIGGYFTNAFLNL